MASTPASRARQRATRAALRAQREGRHVVPSPIRRAVFQGGLDYVQRVYDGQEPMPPKGTPESRQLARYASYARHGKAPIEYLDKFEQYFYHDERKRPGARRRKK